MFSDIKDAILNFISHRLFVLMLIAFVLFGILSYRLFLLQIVQGKEHLDSFTVMTQKQLVSNGARGNIYDCNGNILAYNRLTYSLTLENDSSVSNIAQRRKVSENQVQNEIISKLIDILDKNGDSIINSFGIKLSKNGEFVFTLSDSALLQFKKEVYSAASVDKLTKKQKNADAKTVFNYLRNGNEDIKKDQMFGVSDEYSDEEALKIVAVRYMLYLNRYNQYVPVTIAMDLSDSSVAAVQESLEELPGASIANDSVREYNNSIYFSQILGYTGVISEEEKEELNETRDEKNQYDGTEIIGKSGIEQEYEDTLQGKKGSKTVIVNNVGKILQEDTSKTVESSSGGNVYLTIDSDLQMKCYSILERRLAGILLTKIQNKKIEEENEDKYIDIDKVYYALFDNDVISVEHMKSKKAENTEKNVNNEITSQKKKVENQLEKEFLSDKTPQKSLTDENKEYMQFIYNAMFDEGLMTRAEIDSADETLLAWKAENISLGEFLEYAIKQRWVDTTLLEISNDYYDTEEIYKALIEYIIKLIDKDDGFGKLIIQDLIESGIVSGDEVCQILYEQGVLEKEVDGKEDRDYEGLTNGTMSAYQFIYNKIKTLAITPAMLALNPCTGSIVITDTKTGKVKAMVSYPSYDNNRLANNLDTDYYTELLSQEKTTPLYNKATLSRTAPGSTFKPISAIAGLTEKVITKEEEIEDTGIFESIKPSPKCWVYPGKHGKINVTKAIEVSCNCFFFEVGYRLGTTSAGKISDEQGLNTLKKYASMFGLDKKSGIELSEIEPNFSTEDCVRSAIGQGSHSYAPIQLSRYVTALANGGDCFNLSIINKVTDSKDKLISEFAVSLLTKANVSDDIWDIVHEGMYQVVNGKDEGFDELYAKLPVYVAGKTGTAQEQDDKANHALFVSYAPYENPEISVAVVIPNGYSSKYAVDTAYDVYSYYFKDRKSTKKADDKDTEEGATTEESATTEEGATTQEGATTEEPDATTEEATTEEPNEAAMPYANSNSQID